MREYYTSEEVDKILDDDEWMTIDVDIMNYDSHKIETVKCLVESSIYNQLNENEFYIDDEPVNAIVINNYKKCGYKSGAVIDIHFTVEKPNPYHELLG